MPRPGQVLGLVGTNGIGKSTALKILAGKLKPNLGKFDVRILFLLSLLCLLFINDAILTIVIAIMDLLSLFCSQAPPDWQEILTYFRGSELQNYFTKILEDNLKVL